MTDFLGASFNEVFIIISLLLWCIDVFFSLDKPSYIAYLIWAYLITIHLELSVFYSLLTGVLAFVGFVIFHFTVWEKVVARIHDRLIAPMKHEGGIERLIGESGTIKVIEGRQYLIVNKEVYTFRSQSNQTFSAGEEVIIQKIESDKLIIH